MKRKRVISFVIILTLAFSLIPAISFAAAFTTYEQFATYLNGLYGSTMSSNQLYEANFSTYLKYDNQIVYGSPFGDTATGDSIPNHNGTIEYRYLGYSYNGITKVTNTYFPADSGGGGTPLIWVYSDVSDASKSWDNIDTDQKNHMLNAPLSYSGTEYTSVTVTSIGGVNKAKVLTLPTWNTGFSLFTEHYYHNKLRYATLTGPSMGTPKLACTVSTPNSTYTMAADQTSVTVPVTVTTNADLDGTYVKASQISGISAIFNGTSSPAASGVKSASVTVNKVFNKSDFNGPGTYTRTLDGTGILKSKYGDALTAAGSKTITVIIANTSAYVEVVATASPYSKQITGTSNETITITANAALKQYTNAANVASWTWYAKLDGEDSTVQSSVLSGGSLTSSISHTFTVDKSKFSVNSYLQKIKITAVAKFKANVGSDAQLQNSTYTETEFYKAAVPVLGEPTAVITAPNSFEAGSSVSINGYRSSSPNGAIVYYYWELGGAVETAMETGSGNVTYLYTGTYDIVLYVMDSAGEQAYTSKTITVTPPKPKAACFITGSLKENRKFTIDSSTSYSTAAYPINTGLTKWTITPVSGGTVSDIKYEGVLDGNVSRDILIKKTGTYNITLTVYNSLGYSDTITKTIWIAQDAPPETAFFAPETVMRDPADSNLAYINVTDQSYSPDGDIISSRVWTYFYDSDNDGDFTDETVMGSIDSGTDKDIEIKAPEVGNYKITLKVKEEFGQETIISFVSESDYLTSACDGRAECINNAPSASFSLVEKQLVDVSVVTDYTGTKLTSLVSELSSLKSSAYTNSVDLNYTINDGSTGIKAGSIIKDGQFIKFRAYNNSSYYRHDGSYYSYVPASGAVGALNYRDVTTYDTNNSFSCYITENGDMYGVGTSTDNIFSPFPQPVAGTVSSIPVNFNSDYIVKSPAIGNPNMTYTGQGKTYKDAFICGSNIISLDSAGKVQIHGSGRFHQLVYIGAGGLQPYYYGPNDITTNAKQITGGDNTLLVLKNDGTVWGKGNACFGILGPLSKYSWDAQYLGGYPAIMWLEAYNLVQIPNLTNIKKIFYSTSITGRNEYPTAYAVDTDNRVWTWGYVCPDTGVSGDDYIRAGYYGTSDPTARVLLSTPAIIPGLDGSDIQDMVYGTIPVEEGSSFTVSGTTYKMTTTSYALRILKTDGTVWAYKDGTMTQVMRESSSEYTYRYIGSTKTLTGAVTTNYELSNIVAISNLSYMTSGGKFYGSSTASSPRTVSVSALSTPTWQTHVFAPNLSDFSTSSLKKGSDRYFMWVSDGTGDSYSSGYGNYFGMSSLSASFAEKILEANYSIIAVCPSSTYDFDSGIDAQEMTIRSFVNSSLVAGILYDSGQYAAAANDLRTKYATPKDTVVEAFAIVDEDALEYKTYYSDYEGDPMYDSKWRFDHVPSYFENNTGTASFSGICRASPVTTFTQTGKYEITYMVQDNPKSDAGFDEYKLWSKDRVGMTVFAHRRPVAAFNMGFTGLNTSGNYISSLSDNSYDPDHISLADRGIVSWEWKWKDVDDDSWTSCTDLPSTWAEGETYLVSLVVTDMEGASSLPHVLTLSTDLVNLVPDIDCTPVKKDWTNENVPALITAVDTTPDLSHIKYAWSDSTETPSIWTTVTATSVAELSTTATAATTGIWYLHMMACDAAGGEFSRVRGPFSIDRVAPEIDCSPASVSVAADDLEAIITATDTGGSGLASIEHAWSDSTAVPVSGWTAISAGGVDSFSYTATLTTDGTYYLFMKATDVAGNSYTRYRGTFTRTSLKITGVSLTGYWNHWRGQKDIFGRVMSVEPHRFLSYEAVKIDVTTLGDPDHVTIRLSPELESMYFTDIYENTYSYYDDVGYIETFPLVMTKSAINTYMRDYVLPLAKSTKSISGARLGTAYWMLITAVKGENVQTWLIDDIDITGNIFDNTYIQPVDK